MQLANDSRQDFPFRRIVAYLLDKTWEYPRFIPGLLNQAATNFGVDSIRPMFQRFMDDRALHPEKYFVTESALNAVGGLLVKQPTTLAAGLEVYRIITEQYPRSARGFLGLADAYERTGNIAAAADARQRAAALERSP